MRRHFATLATIWRFASPYFRSEDRWAGRIVARRRGGNRIVDRRHHRAAQHLERAFYNALQDRNWDAFVYQLGYFCVLAGVHFSRGLSALSQSMAADPLAALDDASYLDHWLAGANHYRMQFLGDAADNPDQRISEDIAQFIRRQR